MNPAVEAVLKAWTNPGPVQEYHRDMQRDLTFKWPVLARALDELAAEARGGRL